MQMAASNRSAGRESSVMPARRSESTKSLRLVRARRRRLGRARAVCKQAARSPDTKSYGRRSAAGALAERTYLIIIIIVQRRHLSKVGRRAPGSPSA